MNFNPHHIAFTVNNLEESIKWYQEKLGFELIHKYEKEIKFALLRLDQVKIEIFDFGNETSPLPNYRKGLMIDLKTVGTKHLAIEVSELDTFVGELRYKNVEFENEIDEASFGGRFIFLKDINGILIELYSNK